MRLPRLLLCGLLAAACGRQPAPAPTPPTPPPPVATETAESKPPAEAPLALWPQVQRGVLPNGLTWYILPHQQPRQRAALWLAVNAGSLQEDDDQQGLAHFVEHMAFNGTGRFPRQAIVDYFEKIGMAFGPHVNAYTSFDQTVYQLQVPTDDPGYLDKGLDVLRDWAAAVSFDPAEVDKERGVVLEEWRLGRGAWSRIFDKQAATLFRGTRYARRLPIGKPDILKKAPRAALTRYYQDWYRPDLMAVIVVGEVDPAAVEKLIAAKFGDLKKPDKPRPRIDADKLTADGTLISIETDAEMPQVRVDVHNLFARRSESTATDFRHYVVDRLYHTVDQMRPLVETYLASLPGKGRKEKRKDVGIRNPRGVVDKVIARGSEPKAAVSLIFHGEQPWTLQAQRDVDTLASVLRIRLREILREEMGGVYGVGVWGGIARAPRQIRTFNVRFGCAPENVAALRKAVFDEIARMQRDGVTQDYLDKVKETYRRGFETDREQNWWWRNQLIDAYEYGDDPRQIVALDPVLARVTAANVKPAARRFLDKRQYVAGVLQPGG